MNIFPPVWKNVALILASAATAYPMLRDNFIRLKQRQHRDKIISAAKDIDSEIEQLVRQRLQQQGYDCAQTIPLKVFESEDNTLTLCNTLDCCIGFAEQYEKKLKKMLDKKKNASLSHNKKLALEDFIFSLDHEMFHIQNHHDQQATFIRILIPMITELVAWPMLIQLATASNPLFMLGLIVSIFCKRIINKCLEILHARSLEKKAEKWAIDKNNNRESLKNYSEWQRCLVDNTIVDLVSEQIECGKSSSIIFPLLVKLFNSSPFDFDVQRYDTDDEYAKQCNEKIDIFLKKLYQQPYQWPLRLLRFEYDPRHPDPLDMIQIAQDRVNLLDS